MLPPALPRPGYVYLLTSKPNETLYLGVTSSLSGRVRRHLEGETPGFALTYSVNRLVWFERHERIEDAIRRERQLKKWRREWKLDLVRTSNPSWRDLALEVMSAPGDALGMPEVGRVSATEAAEVIGDAVPEGRHSVDSRVRGNDEGEEGGCLVGSETGEAGNLDGAGMGRRLRGDNSLGGSESGPTSRPGRNSEERGGSATSRTARNPSSVLEAAPALEAASASPSAPPHLRTSALEATTSRPRAILSRVAALAAVLLIAACGDEPPESQLVSEGPENLVALAVEVDAPEPDDSLGAVRSTFQLDGAGASWYDALAAPGRDPAMGLTAGDRTVLHGWRWWSDADSVALGPQDLIRGVARPDVAVRSYMERDTSGFFERILGQIQGERPARLSERVTLLDGTGDQAALLVEVADSIGVVGFRPVRSERRAAGEYTVRDLEGVLAFAAAADVPTDSTVVPEGPIWTAVAGGSVRSTSAAADVPEGGRDQAFRLGEVTVETPGAVAVATGPTAQAAAAAARSALEDGATRREARSERLASVLEDVDFATEDETTNMAFRWAVLTLDALTVRDSSRTTLLPGLPGVEPESFPSVAWTLGAFLDTGRWETAREILTTLGDAQRFDRRIDLLGRAPDLVRLGNQDDVFATADGTPLFLKAAGDYVRATGDRGLVSGGPNFWFKTVFALRGIYEPDSRNGAAMDSLGRLVARDRRGTWLEGDPERGGLRRRGPVAEGQGALFGALSTATQFAEIMGVSQRSSATWYADTSRVLVRQFERDFVEGGVVRDRLEGDGQLRPSGLLALSLMDGLPAETRAQLARALAERLAFPYGVASLAQTDSLFHPYLEAPAYYTPESARANGAVWTWLAGPVATLMAETGGADPAAELLDAQARLLLDAGAVGAIPELVAGHPRDAESVPEVGGVPLNPWSQAGYVEGTIGGLVGARYADADTLVIAPRLPEAWGATTVRLRLGEGAVRLTLEGDLEGAEVAVEPQGNLSEGAALVLEAGGRRVAVPLASVQGDTLVAPLEPFEVAVSSSGATLDGEEVPSGPSAGSGDAWDGFAFAQPDLRDEYPVMRAVANQRQLSDDQILRSNPAASVNTTQTDPQGDDWGATGTFVYPDGLEDGVLDATYLEIARDDSTTFFRAEFVALADNPQTFVAFAIDTEEGGTDRVGRQARYAFPEDAGYEYVIYVGDGLVVEDAGGRELGRLSAGSSAFDPTVGALEFGIPTFVIPTLPRGTTVTMLVGARVPGGGVGEFAPVDDDAGPDVGGGRVDNVSPNVYDVATVSVR